jgi:hypothetical protein
VRKSFLDGYAGDVIVLECYMRFWPLWGQLVRDAAAQYGIELTDQQAESWARRLTARSLADYLRPRVARVLVPSDPLPAFADELFRYQRQLTTHGSNVEHNPVHGNPSIFRGFEQQDYSWWWPIFFYRFVGVDERSGDNLNYAQRIRGATATVMPGSWVIYHSPGPVSADSR